MWKTVGVLVGIDQGECGAVVKVSWQRQLTMYPVQQGLRCSSTTDASSSRLVESGNST